MKKRKEDLISRQDFFMKAKSKALHILSIAFASSTLLTVTAKAKTPSRFYMGTCFMECVMNCGESCLNVCYTSCVSQYAMVIAAAAVTGHVLKVAPLV